MKYINTVDHEELKRLQEAGLYLNAIRLLLDDVRKNYERVPNEIKGELTNLYNSISFFGKENNLGSETERRILLLVKSSRENFKEQIEALLELER